MIRIAFCSVLLRFFSSIVFCTRSNFFSSKFSKFWAAHQLEGFGQLTKKSLIFSILIKYFWHVCSAQNSCLVSTITQYNLWVTPGYNWIYLFTSANNFIGYVTSKQSNNPSTTMSVKFWGQTQFRRRLATLLEDAGCFFSKFLSANLNQLFYGVLRLWGSTLKLYMDSLIEIRSVRLTWNI